MSGGSFDYLCYEEFYGRKADLENMATALEALGTPASFYAARKTRDLLDAMAVSDWLREVWRAVEWWKSCDYGVEQVHEALNKGPKP